MDGVKRIFLCLTAVFCLVGALCACRKTKDTPDLPGTLARVQGALGGEEAFIAADEDFIATNFGEPAYLSQSRVGFDAGGATREIGLFLLDDPAKTAEFEERVRAYLTREAEALASLAALYPAGELENRLALYKNAAVGSKGAMVYYFVLDQKDTRKALAALSEK